MSDTIVVDGEVSLDILIDGEANAVIKVGHEVVTEQLTVTQNGVYEPKTGVDGYSRVSVEIPSPAAQRKTVTPTTSQQVIEPDDGYDYLSAVTVGGYFNLIPLMGAFTGQSGFQNAVFPETVELDFEGLTVSSMYKTFNGITGCDHLILKNINYPENSGVSCQEIFKNAQLKILEFKNCIFIPGNQNYPFSGSTIEEIRGYIDMTYRTANLNIPATMQEIRFVESTIHDNFSVSGCKNLTVDSLISIANGLSAEVSGKTLNVQQANLTDKLQTLGNDDNGTFVADKNGSMSLQTFITSVKGWTIQS